MSFSNSLFDGPNSTKVVILILTVVCALLYGSVVAFLLIKHGPLVSMRLRRDMQHEPAGGGSSSHTLEDGSGRSERRPLRKAILSLVPGVAYYWAVFGIIAMANDNTEWDTWVGMYIQSGVCLFVVALLVAVRKQYAATPVKTMDSVSFRFFFVVVFDTVTQIDLATHLVLLALVVAGMRNFTLVPCVLLDIMTLHSRLMNVAR
jgi:hypothetical protein